MVGREGKWRWGGEGGKTNGGKGKRRNGGERIGGKREGGWTVRATGMGGREEGRRKRHEGLKAVQGSQGKVRGFVDGSHEWGREGSGDCGRVVVEESGVSKSSRHDAKRRSGLCFLCAIET